MKDKRDLSLHQLYNVRNSQEQIWVPYGPLAWSTTNIVVFPSNASHRNFLHFFHPDTPWEVSVNITPHTSTITDLKFDGRGVLLCVIDVHSMMSIWSMTGSIINDWQLIQLTEAPDSLFYTIDTQTIINFSWTNIGQNYVRKSWVVKNEDVTLNWISKFSKNGISTLLKSKSLDVSVICISSRGLLSLVTPGKKAKTAYLPITNMQCADIVVPGKNFVDVATVDVLGTLRVYTVELESENLKFILSRIVELAPSNPSLRIVGLKFDNPCSIDCNLFVLSEGDETEGGTVEIWELVHTQVPLNPVFQSLPSEPKTKLHWTKKHSYQTSSKPLSVQVPTLPYTACHGSDTNRIGRCILVGCADSTVKILDRSTLFLHETLGDEQKPLPQNTEYKAKRGIKKQTNFSFSPAGCCLVASAGGIVSIYSFRNLDIEPESEVVWLCSVLEHCILNGWNHWEIMCVAIRREDTLSRLELTLNRSFDAQNPDIRQLYFSRMMSIKMTLYKLQQPTSHWPQQLWSCQFLNCLTDMLKSMLPTDTVNNFICPADVELNSLIGMVDMKQFQLSEQMMLTQQPLFQWILDYAQLISICVLPQKRTSSTENWQSVVTNSKTLNNLRDMLGLIKIWSTLHPRCSPILSGSSSDNTDYSNIFKSISQLVKQFPTKSDIPSSDYDKIQLFQQKLTVLPTVLVSALVRSSTRDVDPASDSWSSTAQEYFFQCEPNHIKCAKMLCEGPILPLSKVNSVINNTDRDMLRNMVLSAHSLHIKQDFIKECVICGCVTTLQQPSTQLQWWLKWKHACICGGNWRKPSVLA